LLSEGGSGTNDKGNQFTVNGIGIDKAAAIAYRNLSVYLFPNATYADARFYAIKAAEDLFGTCSAEYQATINAWYAVGVGAEYSTQLAVDFEAEELTSCNGNIILKTKRKARSSLGPGILAMAPLHQWLVQYTNLHKMVNIQSV